MFPNFKRIFDIQSEHEFNTLALEIYYYQYDNNSVYKEFVTRLNKPKPTHFTEIPFLPISFFKTHQVISANNRPEIVFKSSGTTQRIRSEHHVVSTEIYLNSFLATYSRQVGNPKDQVILALLPSYIEQGNSSLVYMVDRLICETRNKLSGFLLNSIDEIEQRYLAALNSGKKVIIFGVSYALLDLAQKQVNLSKAIIIETGGMKGRRQEMSKEALHEELKRGLNVSFISSEYGMTELLSQAYSDQNGLFETPPWMKILIRDSNDPFTYINNGKTGGINVIDLANIYSCSFIATQDLGQIIDSRFKLMGRFDNADIRGCNLLIE